MLIIENLRPANIYYSLKKFFTTTYLVCIVRKRRQNLKANTSPT